MSEEVTIRQVKPTDAAALLTLLKQLNQETPFLLVESSSLQLSVTEEAQQLRLLLATDNNQLFVAEFDGQLVGFIRVTASQMPEIAHIGEVGVAVLRAFWGQGLGTVLLRNILTWAQQNSLIRRLELTVQERNQRAYHLYRSLGFKVEGKAELGYFDQKAGFQTVLHLAMVQN